MNFVIGKLKDEIIGNLYNYKYKQAIACMNSKGRLKNSFDKDAVAKEVDLQREVTQEFGKNATQATAAVADKLGNTQSYERYQAAKTLPEAELQNKSDIKNCPSDTKNRPKNPDGGSNRLPRLTGAAGSFDRIAVGIGKAEKGFAAFLVPLGSVSEQTVFGGITFAGCSNVGREDGTPAVQPQRDFAAVQMADAHRQTVLAGKRPKICRAGLVLNRRHIPASAVIIRLRHGTGRQRQNRYGQREKPDIHKSSPIKRKYVSTHRTTH